MKDGVYEVWLSSEDTGAYGLDVRSGGGVGRAIMERSATVTVDIENEATVDEQAMPTTATTMYTTTPTTMHTTPTTMHTTTTDTPTTTPLNITHLLQSVSSIVAGNGGDGAMVRLGMTNPPYILRHLDAIAAFLRQPNVFSFLHIPVQSGSNRVLKAMQREYTAEDFCMVVDVLQVVLLPTLNRRGLFPASRSRRTLSWASDRSRRKTMPRRWLFCRNTASPL